MIIFAENMTHYNTYTLSNGLRVIHLPSASPVVYCGYQIAVGSRHEQPGEEGLAHFCEHATFKGTRSRTSLQILNALERVGGDLNAFTNKEDTVFYAAIGRQHMARAVGLLSDIVFDSQYPQAEIEKEVEVVCDEIESYNDSPAELIYDEFENLLFVRHPLGHNILGTASQLRTYTSDHLLRFARRHYRPANMVFFAYGDIPFGRLVRMLEQFTPPADAAPALVQAPAVPAAVCMDAGGLSHQLHMNTHQAHVMTGTVAYHLQHPQRMALYLLNNILGGPAMNARLNLSLRERHALVYTVESAMSTYSDTGCWAVYFGCDPHDAGRCGRLVRCELDRMMLRPLSARQLASAKQQLKGQIAIACDNREQFALDFGKSYLHNGRERDIDHLYSQIDAVSAEQLQAVAQELFAPERLLTLTIT